MQSFIMFLADESLDSTRFADTWYLKPSGKTNKNVYLVNHQIAFVSWYWSNVLNFDVSQSRLGVIIDHECMLSLAL